MRPTLLLERAGVILKDLILRWYERSRIAIRTYSTVRWRPHRISVVLILFVDHVRIGTQFFIASVNSGKRTKFSLSDPCSLFS